MARFFQGFATAYLLAALYFGAFLSMPGVTTPPGAAPILALSWPVFFSRIFWFTPKAGLICKSEGSRQ